MTAPAVQASQATAQPASGDNHVVTLPSGITAGDLLLIIFACHGGNPAAITTPSGWAVEEANTTGQICLVVYSKVAAGGDSNPNIVVSSVRSASVALRISGASGDVEASTVSSAASSAPNTLSLAPSWGSADTLWLSVAADQADIGINSGPSGYGSSLNCTTQNGPQAWVYWKSATGASEDPGAMSLTDSVVWLGWTLGVKPGGSALGIGGNSVVII